MGRQHAGQLDALNGAGIVVKTDLEGADWHLEGQCTARSCFNARWVLDDDAET
jgi:hypothetical protein